LHAGTRCPLLVDVENGSWLLVTPDRFFGAVVRYTCEAGFQLSGPAERVCRADGEWSGTSPTCDTEGKPFQLVLRQWQATVIAAIDVRLTKLFSRVGSGRVASKASLLVGNVVSSCRPNLSHHHHLVKNEKCSESVRLAETSRDQLSPVACVTHSRQVHDDCGS